MPTYTLINTETGDEFEEFCTWDELEEFLKKNTNFKQKVSAPALVGDHIGGVGPKVDGGMKENLARIAEAHPTSALADNYGTKSNKDLKTHQVLRKHGVLRKSAAEKRNNK
tara:strand:+ start:168 stop:500 length:333 start_codon:yes stop_codon:yes gene_type:complete